MSKFKVGDQVKVIKIITISSQGHLNEMGTITKVKQGFWDSASESRRICGEDYYCLDIGFEVWEKQLELVNSKEQTTISKFKVGDRIINISLKPGPNQGKYGNIIEIDAQYTRVRYDDGEVGGASEPQESYKLINQNKITTIMKTVTTFFKKLTDSKVQALSKAGYINGDLEPTQKAKDAISEILFFTHYEELVDRAEKEIKEEEESNKK